MVPGARHTGGHLRDLDTGSTRTLDAPGDPTASTRAGVFVGTTGEYVLMVGHREYVRDVRTDRTRLLPADDTGMALVFDGHARVAAFQSWKDDWVPGDTNKRGDFFLLRLR